MSGRSLLIGIIIIVIAVSAFLFFYNKKKEEKKNTNTNTNPTSPTIGKTAFAGKNGVIAFNKDMSTYKVANIDEWMGIIIADQTDMGDKNYYKAQATGGQVYLKKDEVYLT